MSNPENLTDEERTDPVERDEIWCQAHGLTVPASEEDR